MKMYDGILCGDNRFHILTDVGKVVQRVGPWSMINNFTSDQQSHSVKQYVDGVPGLVDGHNDGSSTTGHSEKPHSKTYINNKYNKDSFSLQKQNNKKLLPHFYCIN